MINQIDSSLVNQLDANLCQAKTNAKSWDGIQTQVDINYHVTPSCNKLSEGDGQILLKNVIFLNWYRKDIYASHWMIAQMVERLLCTQRTQVQIPAPAPYEITL